MKTYNTFKDLLEGFHKAEVPDCILKTVASLIRQIMDVDAPETAEILTMREVEETLSLFNENDVDNFDFNLGGELHICETEEDLKQVQTVSWCAPEQAYYNITQTVAACDQCSYLFDKRETGWGIYFLATNNAGGPAYYIPEKLWAACKFDEQVKATAEHWA